MCGIAGIVRVTQAGEAARAALGRPAWESIPEHWLDVLDDSITHRGPDGAGRFRDRAVRPDGCVVDVALVHRRLAIIDPACGRQPMVSPGAGQGVLIGAGRSNVGAGPGLDERGERGWPGGASAGSGTGGLAPSCSDCVAVIFNGCIYNHRELRAALVAAGHSFSTDHSDTEVLVHGWRHWGLGDISHADPREVRQGGLCSRLDGMFAFAAWDGRTGRLTLARDQHGEKPLYRSDDDLRDDGSGLHAFSSSAAGLFRWRRMIGQRLSWTSEWYDWAREGYSERANLVTEVPPCHTVTLGRRRGRPGVAGSECAGGTDPADPVARYEPAGSIPMDSTRAGPAWGRSRGLSVDELDGLLDAAVRSRLESDVPLGCFLSGGVDSSLMALYAKRALGRLGTFSVKMPDAAYDESAFAERAAGTIGSNHATLACDAHPADDLMALIAQLGLPFGDSSLLPMHWVSRAARAHVTVALSGDGGDELFAGYERYAAAAMLARFGLPLMLAPATMFRDASPKSLSSKARRLIEAARGRGYADLRSIFSERQARRLGLRGRSCASRAGRPALFGSREEAIDRAIDSDCREYLPGDLMRKADTAAMSVALELRSPMLSNAVTAAARSARIDALLPGGERKGLLRAVARRYLPAEIVDRPKMGFAIPVGDWFRTNYGGMRDLLLDHLNSREPFGPDSLGVSAMINMDFVRRMVREHDDAGARSMWPWKGRDHSQRLYMMLVLSIWGKWIGGLSAEDG